MITELYIFILCLIIFYNIFIYKRLHHHFAKYGLKFNPGVPIFGNTFCSTFGYCHVTEDLEKVYKQFPDEKYVGFMEGSKRIILVRDPELMKTITIKHSNHFMNRKNIFPKEIEPLLGSSVMSMKDNEWRVMRAKLSTSFSGSKMRQMLPFMIQTSNNIVDYLKDHQSEDIDVIDIMRRYATDAIASAGYGIHVNSLKDRNNIFYTTGETAVHFTLKKRLYYFVTTQFPVIAKIVEFLGIEFLSPEGTQFFRRLVAETIEYRKKHDIMRADFIHLLKDISEDWSLDKLTGQVYFAFLASYESIASTLTMCVHELAIHPQYEERLYQEISKYQDMHNEFCYDNISQLKYLDCVLNEAGRKWSVAVMMDRVCSKTYMLPPSREGGLHYVVRPGDMVYNVVNAVHLDPQHHPEPEVFNPDRFSDENKKNIKSFTFMPFGMGPRSCLGMRYAILVMKTLLYHLVLNFRITSCKKTTNPIQLQPGDFVMRAVGETYVRFESRT